MHTSRARASHAQSQIIKYVSSLNSRIIATRRALYRDLWRQTTYLPDPIVRQWCQSCIRQRFQHSRNQEDQSRIENGFRQARHFANSLRRANEGERKPLLALLELAYGRRGRRRRELLQPLLHSSSLRQRQSWIRNTFDHSSFTKVQTAQVMEALELETRDSASISRPRFPPLSPALRALAESQMKHQQYQRTGATLRRIEPVIPELNSWMRPMPWVRVKNMQRKGYAAFLAKLSVPLPATEWEHVRRLAMGEQTFQIPTRRRVSEQNEVELEEMSVLETVMLKPRPDTKKVFANRDAHRLTQRYLQRVYQLLFAPCSKLDWNLENRRWEVTWGYQALNNQY